MSLVVFDNVSLHLGGKRIVDGLTLRIAEGDRIGLIGPNGSGKTTLLRLIAAEQQPDGGSIHVGKRTRVGYLPQDVHLEGGRTLMDFVRSSVPGRQSIEDALADAEGELSELAENPNVENYEDRMMDAAGRVGQLHEQLAEFEQLFSDHEAKRILAGLGFQDADHDRDVGEFSGGWKMRAVVSSLLFQRPEVLLLDEPTNHLDMPSVAWLSAFLQRWNRAFVLISHDREFLNEQIRRVVSFEPEGVRQYGGDYERYKKQRAEELVLLENRAKNIQREREQTERFVKRFRAKATKAKQVQSRVKKLEKMEEEERELNLQEIRQSRVMSFRFPPAERAGKTVLEVDELEKTYGEHQVLRGVNARVARGDRIALLGVNGAGKTTLLRILAGEIEATGGGYEFGHKTKVGYYAQHHADVLDKRMNVYDIVRSVAKEASHQQIRGALGAMLFGDQEIEKLVGVLSGGERARVALAQLLVDPGNVLLMDEPTNHLDLESSERLAEAMDSFDGTLLFVSHNRAFIRRLAKTIWFVENGEVVVYPGSLDDYMTKCRLEGKDPASATVGEGGTKNAPGTTAGAEKKRSKKATQAKRPRRRPNKKLKPLQRRSAELEARIAKLEAEQEERSAQLSDAAIVADDAKRTEVTNAFSRAQVELEVAMDTWSEVQEELEALLAA
ncbi:MAG: ABC-F family ATP-binding cassette domain-containing protein, partial [Myxococcota bacterium]